VKILYFGHLKDITREEAESWTINESLSAEALWERLIRQHPELQKHKASIRLAKNHEYIPGETIFCDSDEVALIPPVSGG